MSPRLSSAIFTYIETDSPLHVKNDLIHGIVVDMSTPDMSTSLSTSDDQTADMSTSISPTTTLLQLVEQLGPYLTHVDTTLRAQGTMFLSDVLSGLHDMSYRLPAKDVVYLVQFYIDRLRDIDSTASVLHGLDMIVRSQRLPISAAVDITMALFRELHVQSMSQSCRSSVFRLLNTFLMDSKWMHILVNDMGQDFVFGFMQAIDGEKDPRNLMIVFAMAAVVASKFPLSSLAEELFEVTSCYFPITFEPPPNDPYGISKHGLETALLKCLGANIAFAPYCVSLLVEKLSSDFVQTKIDTLRAIGTLTALLGATMRPLEGDLWSMLRQELLHASDSDVHMTAVHALGVVVQSLDSDSSLPDDFLKLSIRDLLYHVRAGVSLVLGQRATVALQAMAMAGPRACTQVLNCVVPMLLEQFEGDETTINDASASVAVATGFIAAPQTLITDSRVEVNAIDLHSSLTPFVERLRTMAERALLSRVSNSMRAAGCSFSRALCLTTGLLPDAELFNLVSPLATAALYDEASDVRTTAERSLVGIAEVCPHLILPLALPALFSALEASLGNNASVKDSVPEMVAHVAACHISLYSVVIPRLFQLLSVSPEEVRLLCCIRDIVKNVLTPALAINFEEEIAIPLWKLYCNASRSPSNSSILDIVSEVIRGITQALGISDSDGAQKRMGIQAMDFFVNVDEELFKQRSCLLPFFNAVIGSLRSDDTLLGTIWKSVTTKSFLGCLFSLALHDKANARAAALGVASIVNKMPENEIIEFTEEFINAGYIIDILGPVSQGNVVVGANESVERAMWALVWFVKAVVMRGGSLSVVADTPTELLVSLLPYLDCAAVGFATVIEDSDEVLSPESFVKSRILYKQRFFAKYSSYLVHGHEIAKTPVQKERYLRALSLAMRHIPKQVLIMSLSTVLPLVLQSLSSSDSGIVTASLSTVPLLMAEAPDIVSEHIDTFTAVLLQLSRFPGSMRARVQACEGLGALTTLPYSRLHPLKPRVLRDLGPALDDHKRLVRRASVAARGQWYELGTLR